MCDRLVQHDSSSSSVGKEGTAYNRPVLLVGNDKLEVAVVKQGGSTLRIQIQGDPRSIGAFGNADLVPGVPDDRKLTGPTAGHFVYVAGFESPSKEEAAAGLAVHGEGELWVRLHQVQWAEMWLPEAVGRPPGKGPIQQDKVGYFIDFRQEALGKTTTAAAGDLPAQQLD